MRTMRIRNGMNYQGSDTLIRLLMVCFIWAIYGLCRDDSDPGYLVTLVIWVI
jgi:hypothetical protein